MLDLPELGRIKTKDTHVHDALKKIQTYVNNLATQVGVDANRVLPPPATLQQVMVSTAPSSGQIKVGVVDPSPSKTTNYFYDYDTDPNFSDPITVPMGASRNHQIYLGRGTYFLRAYSQTLGSDPSPKVYFPGPITVQGEPSPASVGSQGSGQGIQGGFGESNPSIDQSKEIISPLNLA